MTTTNSFIGSVLRKKKKTYRKREYFSTLRTPKKRTFQQK